MATDKQLSSKKKLLFSAVLLLIVLLLVECVSSILWHITFDGASQRTINALCGTTTYLSQKLPNTFWHHDLNPNHPIYKDKINNRGTLGESFEMPKPNNELRIICLGDSTVEGWGLEPSKSFPAILERMLNSSIPSTEYENVTVINAGIGSHNSAFNLSYLAFRLIHYEPDYVVIKSTYNDFLPFCIPGMNFDYTHAFPEPFHLERNCSLYWTMARYSFFLKVFGARLFHEEVLSNPFQSFSGTITKAQLQQMDFSSNKTKFAIYGENIRSMILLCKGRGITPILLDLPTSPSAAHYGAERNFGLGFRKVILRLNAELERIAEEEMVSFVVTSPLNDVDFWDHCHNTESGNYKIAKILHHALSRIIKEAKMVRSAPAFPMGDSLRGSQRSNPLYGTRHEKTDFHLPSFDSVPKTIGDVLIRAEKESATSQTPE